MRCLVPIPGTLLRCRVAKSGACGRGACPEQPRGRERWRPTQVGHRWNGDSGHPERAPDAELRPQTPPTGRPPAPTRLTPPSPPRDSAHALHQLHILLMASGSPFKGKERGWGRPRSGEAGVQDGSCPRRPLGRVQGWDSRHCPTHLPAPRAPPTPDCGRRAAGRCTPSPPSEPR